MTVTEIRVHIDDLDDLIMQALHDRFELCKSIGIIKHGEGICDPAREAEILSRVADDRIKAVYQTIFEQAKLIEQNHEE